MIATYRKALRASGYPLAFLFILILAFACEKKEIIFEGPYHVRFTKLDTTVRESNTRPLRLAVHNAGPQLATPITVNYAVGGSAREGIDYRFVGPKGRVVIPANQSFGYIELQLINNANNILESQDVAFTITEIEPANLRIGFGPGEIGKIMRLTIQDECLLSGLYTGSRSAEGSADAVTRAGIAITSTDCKEYTLSNWNVGLFGTNAIKPDLVFIDNGDNSITIPRQTESELSAPRDTIEGQGFVSPLDQSISLSIRIPVRTSDGQRDSTLVIDLQYFPEK